MFHTPRSEGGAASNFGVDSGMVLSSGSIFGKSENLGGAPLSVDPRNALRKQSDWARVTANFRRKLPNGALTFNYAYVACSCDIPAKSDPDLIGLVWDPDVNKAQRVTRFFEDDQAQTCAFYRPMSAFFGTTQNPVNTYDGCFCSDPRSGQFTLSAAPVYDATSPILTILASDGKSRIRFGRVRQLTQSSHRSGINALGNTFLFVANDPQPLRPDTTATCTLTAPGSTVSRSPSTC